MARLDLLAREVVAGRERLRRRERVPLPTAAAGALAAELPSDPALRRQEVARAGRVLLDALSSKGFAALFAVAGAVSASPSARLLQDFLPALLSSRPGAPDDAFPLLARPGGCPVRALGRPVRWRDPGPPLAAALDPASPRRGAGPDPAGRRTGRGGRGEVLRRAAAAQGGGAGARRPAPLALSPRLRESVAVDEGRSGKPEAEELERARARIAALEEALAASEGRRRCLEALVEHTDDMIAYLDADSRVRVFNSAHAAMVERVLGHTLSPGDRPLDWLDPARRQALEALHRRALAGESFRLEYEHPVPDGGSRFFEVRYHPVREGGQVVGFSQFAREVTHFKQVEASLSEAKERLEALVAERTEALARSERVFRALTEHNPDPTVVVDRQGRLSYLSPSLLRAFEAEAAELLGRSAQEFLHPEDAASVAERFRRARRRPGASLEPFRARVRGPRQGWRHVELRMTAVEEPGALEGVVVHARDVTARVRAEATQRRLEAHAAEAQKLGNLGVLSAGIAHDLNNLLLGVRMNAEILQGVLSEADPQVIRSLELVQDATRQASELAAQLLAYAGRRSGERAPLDLNEIAQDMLRLLRASVPRKIELVSRLGADLPAVRAEAGQLRQVVMNLVLNASEAIGPGPGRILLSTECRVLAAQELEACSVGGELPAGRYVLLRVGDDGRGMDAETARRAFEPFVSTKGDGRGLGLAITRGIVHAHGGAVGLRSQPGEGTEVTVALPAAAGAAPSRDPEALSVDAWRGEGLVLVVDDEESVRETTRGALEEFGFRVETARDGGEALEVFRASPAAWACVLLDLAMPVLGGEEVLREIRRTSDVPVILSSGYAEEASRGLARVVARTRFLKKPYGLAELADALRSVLA
ncbi:MAG: PAS domain S-box protein [Planctomycetota bacterium]|nr:MAG: PAS domain S-box protein [Planctomycetota bacterium]